jgi:hypothetical protein
MYVVLPCKNSIKMLLKPSPKRQHRMTQHHMNLMTSCCTTTKCCCTKRFHRKEVMYSQPGTTAAKSTRCQYSHMEEARLLPPGKGDPVDTATNREWALWLLSETPILRNRHMCPALHQYCRSKIKSWIKEACPTG